MTKNTLKKGKFQNKRNDESVDGNQGRRTQKTRDIEVAMHSHKSRELVEDNASRKKNTESWRNKTDQKKINKMD